MSYAGCEASTYRVTGFNEFLDLRRITFSNPLSLHRVCSVCGLVPRKTHHLPCCHILCDGPCGRHFESTGVCPLNCQEVAADSVKMFEFEEPDYRNVLVRCLKGDRTCGFLCRLMDHREHFLLCSRAEVKCLKCGVSVVREFAARHIAECGGDAAAVGPVTTQVPEELAHLCTEAASSTNFIGSLPCTTVEKHKATAAPSTLYLPGPFRGASKHGAWMLMYTLKDMDLSFLLYRGNDAVIAGYTFRIVCRRLSLHSEERYAVFTLELRKGDWDWCVEWPFTMTVAITIAHLRDSRKDIQLTPFRKIVGSRYVELDFALEDWSTIRNPSFMFDDALYLTVEFL
ncbi:hypothetical protein HPB49_007697 [Dermacentor silvarum]|uniref:Uncharacterized protein n=2 Tax=Dermacentor silvarum TaxID=543639 RepID=A0ACB8DWW2_DERSI|nr:hypothetical protein HPB49_007697 [Dermacentor silvarum]